MNGGMDVKGFEQKMVEAETEAMKNMFLKLMDVCYDRCGKGNYVTGHLSKQESICADECVAKVPSFEFYIIIISLSNMYFLLFLGTLKLVSHNLRYHNFDRS